MQLPAGNQWPPRTRCNPPGGAVSRGGFLVLAPGRLDEGFDADADGIADCVDACPDDPANDADGDGLCGSADNCPNTANSGQEDIDSDGIGDVCDPCDDRPVTGNVRPSVDRLWLPYHNMVAVTIDADLAAPNPGTRIRITSVDIAEYTGQEAGEAYGENIYDENNFEPDVQITGDLSVNLRSERTGASSGRTYIITVTATGCSGDYPFTARVVVPHDKGN